MMENLDVNLKYNYCRFLFSLVLCTFSCFSIQALEHPLVVVVNTNSNIQALTKKQVIDIYMGRYQSFPNGNPASPIDYPNHSNEKKRFYKELVNQNEKRIQSYWSRLLFSGRARPPLKTKDSKQVTELVLKSGHALAYILEDKVTTQMRVVYRF